MPFKAERRHQIWSVDIRYLDMHSLQGIEMVYCISILENFSRSILASAISVRQDTEAFFAVFYAAVRRYGVPEMLVSDNGSIFLSHDTRRVCAQLGIEKKEIKKGKPYQNYREAAFGVQRRMADWSFEKAQTWEDAVFGSRYMDARLQFPKTHGARGAAGWLPQTSGGPGLDQGDAARGSCGA